MGEGYVSIYQKTNDQQIFQGAVGVLNFVKFNWHIKLSLFIDIKKRYSNRVIFMPPFRGGIPGETLMV
jgi:hypothetical protein